MAVSENGMTVVVIADRPETLDLLRRNIGELNQSFMDMGYDDISFTFQNRFIQSLPLRRSPIDPVQCRMTSSAKRQSLCSTLVSEPLGV